MVQVAAQHTHIGALACAAIRPTAARLGHVTGLLSMNINGGPETIQHLEAVFATMGAQARKAGATIDLVVLPEREGLESTRAVNSAAAKRFDLVMAAAKKAGINSHDAWPLMQSLLQHHGAAEVFAKTHVKDFHFSQLAHSALAIWLAETLKMQTKGATP